MFIVYAVFFTALLVQWRLWGVVDIANPVVFFLDYHLLFLSFGVLIYYLKIYPAYEISSLTLKLVLLSYFLSVTSAAVTWLFLCAGLNIKPLRASIKRFHMSGSHAGSAFAKNCWWVGVILAAIVFLRSDFAALQGILAGTSYENARVEAASGNGFFILPSQVLLLIGSSWILVEGKSTRWLKMVVFFVSSICMISFGFRSGVVFLFLAVLVFKCYSSYGKLPFLKLAIFSVVMLIAVVAMGVVRQGADDFISRFNATLLWRSFVTLYNLDVIINNYKDFLLGGGIVKEISVVIPGADVNLGMYLKHNLGYEFPGGGITPSYIGAGFVDFGLVGAYLYPVFSGFLVVVVYALWPILLGRSKISFLLLLLFSITTSGISAAGFMTPYLYFGVPIILLASVITVFERRKPARDRGMVIE